MACYIIVSKACTVKGASMKKYGFIVLLLALFIVIVFLGTNQSQTFSKKSSSANEFESKTASDTDVNQLEPVLVENRNPQELFPARGAELISGLGTSVASLFVPEEEEIEEELVESEESEESEDLNEPIETEEWTYESEEESNSTNSGWSNYSPSYSGNGSSSSSSNGSSWQPSSQWTPSSNNQQTDTNEEIEPTTPTESEPIESEPNNEESKESVKPEPEEQPDVQPDEATESSTSESSIESYSIRDDDGDGIGHYNDSNDADPNVQ